MVLQKSEDIFTFIFSVSSLDSIEMDLEVPISSYFSWMSSVRSKMMIWLEVAERQAT